MERLRIAVGVIYNKDKSEVLISRRPQSAHLGGLWEFPGGKCEKGESVREALIRELKEEIDLEIMTAEPLIIIEHHYIDRFVTLDVWEITSWNGEPFGKEGQLVEWVAIEALQSRSFPDANKPIITAVIGRTSPNPG